MQVDDYNRFLTSILKWVTVVLLCKVTLYIVSNYSDYFPPNFASDFLRGREVYFFGAYRIAFYGHILSSPIALLNGTILVSGRFRRRFPEYHRLLGRIQVGLVLLFVAPSGLWMAAYAYTGAIAGIGFALLAVATGICAALGWRQAVNRHFDQHRRWMTRCYMLLCSAIILRLMAGVFTIAHSEPEWTYQLAAWMSWLLPLTVFELVEYGRAKNKSRVRA